MAQASKNTRMSRQAGKVAATDSTIANMETRTTTETVRAARPAGLKTGANYTGQYLYDRFINDRADEKQSQTKLDIVGLMVGAMDADKFGTIIADMVGIAKTFADQAVKDAGKFDADNPPVAVRTANARLKTARNHQTVMRIAFGAMKFCGEELATATNGQNIGYHMIRELGNKLLADKGINWDGTKAETKQDRQQRAEQREETEAMLEVQKAHPRKEDEDRAAYFARMDKMVDKRLAERAAERREATIKAMVDKIKAMAGENLPDVIDKLLSGEPDTVVEASAEVVKVKADTNLH